MTYGMWRYGTSHGKDGAQARAAWQRLGAALADCRTATFDHNGTTVVGTVTRLAFPRLGRSSSAYALALGAAGAPVGVDLVLFQTAASYALYALKEHLGRTSSRGTL